MKYNAPYGVSNPNAAYVNGNPAIGLAGSIPPAQAIELPQREIINAIIAAGLVGSNDDLTQLTQAIELLGRIPVVSDDGVANHIVINPAPAVQHYGDIKIIAVVMAYNNTGDTFVNLSGLGEVTLKRTTGAQLTPNDLTAGGIIIIGWNSGGFQLLSVPGSLAFPLPAQLWHYGVDISSTPNLIVASVDPIGASWPVGIPIAIKVNTHNTGATVVRLNGISPDVHLTRGAGLDLSAGDVATGYIALMMYDGVQAQLINPLVGGAGGSGGDDITGPDRPYWLAVTSATVTAPPGSPALGDTYLIPVGATGAWAGLNGKLAQWNGSGWVYRTYPVGSVIGTSDSSRYFESIGGVAWVEIQLWTLGKAMFYCQM